jgi:predicted GH43/DUF377 family glycosyl hydrolase
MRVEDHRGFSHFTVARSKNGIDDWEIDRQPTFAADPVNYPEEIYGIDIYGFFEFRSSNSSCLYRRFP